MIKCDNCNELTKYIAAFWDGQDEFGNDTHGVTYACHNATCKIEKAREAERRELQAELIRINDENKLNGVDRQYLRHLRVQGIPYVNQLKMAQAIGVSTPQYSGWENGNKAMPREMYDKSIKWLHSEERSKK
ncbi:hypothetical protein AGMMS49975_06000 [Clostridia bacterium]|nr:hypothetical protein AGMMS49975_06000 [Clostridia bacterium]